MSSEEIAELKDVMKEIEKAFSENEIFKPDQFNYLQTGNKLHHLHFHGIPRYSSPKNFAGETWIDKTFGSVPIWPKRDVDHGFVSQVRDAIRPFLSF